MLWFALVGTGMLAMAKSLSIAYANACLAVSGHHFRDALTRGEVVDLRSWRSPSDRLWHPVEHWIDHRGRMRSGLTIGYHAITVSLVGSVVVLWGSSGSRSQAVQLLDLATGCAVALCVFLMLFSALLRRLVLGGADAYASDLQVPSRFRNWAVAKEPIGNFAVYFLWLVLIVVFGGAALDASIASALGGFRMDVHPNPVTWIYFATVTTATVGYGDITPSTPVTEFVVTGQILVGPLFLAWLVAVLIASRTSGAPTPADAAAPDHESGGIAMQSSMESDAASESARE